MSSIIITDKIPSPQGITLGYATAIQAMDTKVAHALEQWWSLEADGWITRGAYDFQALVRYWRSRPTDPEASRLVDCIAFIGNLRGGMPTGIEDANSERVFNTLLKLILRPQREGFVPLKYDHVLEFSSQLGLPVVIERFDRSYGEYSNNKAQEMLYQGRESRGVTAHELFIPQIADVLVENSNFAKQAGQTVVTHAKMPGEHWTNLRIPSVDESGRLRSILLAQCLTTRGGDNSWMFNNPP